MAECEFCETLKMYKISVKACNDMLSDQDKRDHGKYMASYSVAICQYTWYKKHGKRSAGRTTDYRHKGLGFKLNYCPECGRDMRGGQDG